MRALVTSKGLILIGVIFVSAAGLSSFIPPLVQFIGTTHPEAYLQQGSAFLNSLPPGLINVIFNTVQFDAKVISSAGTLEMNSATLVSFVGLFIILAVFFLLQRAIKSKPAADDLVALAAFYIALQVVVGIWIRVGLVPAPLRANFTAWLMTTVIVYMMFRAGAMEDTRILFRGLGEVYLVWAFLFPAATIQNTVNALDRFAAFSATFVPAPTPLFQFLSFLGLILALGQIYVVGRRPSPSAAAVLAVTKQKVDEVFEKAQKLAGQK